jgi:HPt (histidine-containing phosphotransfer) domain-containing protein
VWRRSHENVLARVGVVEQALADASAGTLDDEAREQARSAAHQLAGSAGTFGFPHASALARELEGELEGAAAPSADELPRLAELARTLRAELEGEPGGGEPDEPEEDTEIAELIVVGFGALGDALAAEAARRGLVHDRASSAAAAPSALERAPGALVIVDLELPEGAGPALALVSDAAAGRVVVAVRDVAGACQPVAVARAGARELLERDVGAADALDRALALRDGGGDAASP